MTTRPRLSAVTILGAFPSLDSDGSRVEPPRVEPQSLSIGIVHIGIGAFHRAHQAVFTEDAAAAAGETHWGILGVTGRSDAVVRQLMPQDGLYGVLMKGTDASELRLVGSVRDVAWPGNRTADIVNALAASSTHVVTLTVTEKGYLREPGGGIDSNDPGVANDLVLANRILAGELVLEQSRTLIGLLLRGLVMRFVTSGAPVTVVSCDNLAHNGEVTRALVISAISHLRASAALLTWLETNVAFPSTMVDRITPATTDADYEEAEELLGLSDEGLVVAEPFRQWVIEDSFASDRPRWELAGAIFTSDVRPYEEMKLRILNCTHSLLAYLGALMGYATIAEAIGDSRLREASRHMITDDVLPTLSAPAGIKLDEYRDQILDRFANPSLAHTTTQVAMDGSQKLPQRLFLTVADRLSVGIVPRHLALLTAAWVTYVAETESLVDPLATQLRAAVPSRQYLKANPGAAVRAILGVGSVCPQSVQQSASFCEAVVNQLESVRELAQLN